MSAATDTILRKLRPPFARSPALIYPFSAANPGLTLQPPAGENVLAIGTGTVSLIYMAVPGWPSTDQNVSTESVYNVMLDHGSGVTSLVSGLSSVLVSLGQTIGRGTVLGALIATQMSVSIYVDGAPINPASVNAHWNMQNDSVVQGQGGKIRFAPDTQPRDLSGSVTVTMHGGAKYFQPSPTAPLLVNAVFNPPQAKTGLGVTGYSGQDYWNSYALTDYEATASGACPGFYTFSAPSIVPLLDYRQQFSPVFLERIAPMLPVGDQDPGGFMGHAPPIFDPIFFGWIGGWSGDAPYTNSFRLRGMPAGSYTLYLYAEAWTFSNEDTLLGSIFSVSVNTGPLSTQSNTPGDYQSFVNQGNYVVFPLTVPPGGYITVTVYGFFSGFQLLRD